MSDFREEVQERVAANAGNAELLEAARTFLHASTGPRYSYNFSWLGRPIIQFPQDMVAMQELIWTIRPDLVIETGIAHGGSLIFYASLLELNAVCGGPADAIVLGVDIDIRAHNRTAIEEHPLYRRIRMIEGSSTDPAVVADVRQHARGRERVLVCLDSSHTRDHVLAELHAYAPLTTAGSYCVVFDTVIDDLPADLFADRPWGPGNSPRTAVAQFLESRSDFEVDRDIDAKLLISAAPGGYLRRVQV